MPTVKLTDPVVRSLTSAAPQTDYWDQLQQGLGMRVGRAGGRTWVVRYRTPTGTRRRLKLGRYPSMSLAQARQAAKQVLADVLLGGDPQRERARRCRAKTVRDMAGDYLERYARRNKRSWTKDRAILDRHVLPMIGDLDPRKVTRTDVEAILERARARGLSTQINRIFEVVRAMFNWAVGLHVDTPPTDGMRRPVRERPRERNLSHDELRIIWRRIEQGTVLDDGRRAVISEPVQIALKLLLVTGQRVSEVSQAAKAEVGLDSRVWTLPGERAKNGRSHRVPLSALAVSLIERAWALSGGSAYLFPTPVGRGGQAKGAKPIGSTALNHALAKALRGAGVIDVRPHDFRETVATGMAALYVPEAHIAAVLNHARGTITARHYSRHSFEREKRDVLDAWAAQLEKIIGPLGSSGLVRLPDLPSILA